MAEKIDKTVAPDELRALAEARLRGKTGTAAPSGTVGADPLRLLHELQVHQLELEMQNLELRRARDEVEAVLEKYTDLYDFAPVGYLTLDRHGIIRRANLTGAELLGVARSRLNGWRFDHFLAVETRSAFTAFLEQVYSDPGKAAYEGVLQNHGLPPRAVQIEAVADFASEECRIALIDVSARKRAEEALRQEKEASEALRRDKEAAEATSRAKSQFLANMSHELRTPMTGILGMIQLALDEDLAPVPRGYLETTLNSARSLLQILNDILDMAKSEAGRLALEEKPFALPACVAEAVEVIMPEVRRKGLDLVVPLASEMPLMVVGDQLRLRQILINLIGNAVKFTKKGRVVVRVAAGRTTAAGKREITFSVSDTGIGIPEDKRALLFRPFSQIDASHSRTYGGSGLGLAICRELVERMGGTISCESQEGAGSTFAFTVSLGDGWSEHARATSESLAADSSAPAAGAGADEVRRPRLLLAEDDPVNRDLLKILLRRANFDLDLAEDGQQAVDMWEQGSYDLVLMDVQMPRLDGFEATRLIRDKERARGSHTPIIALTAHAFADDRGRCLAAGMDAYISKPINFNKSLQVIGEILAQKSNTLH